MSHVTKHFRKALLKALAYVKAISRASCHLMLALSV
jgi:hypothetical protein